jgi:hypothetical protein
VFLQTKNVSVIDPNPFKHPVTIEKTVVENGYLRLVLAKIRSVDVHPPLVSLFHWSALPPKKYKK